MNQHPQFATVAGNDIGAPPDTGGCFLSRELERLRRTATLIKCSRGTAIFCEGNEAPFVYVLDDGIVRISRCAESGHRQILAFRVPGDLFGLPNDGRYLNSAEAVSSARLFRISWMHLQQMMLNEPKLQLELFNRVTRDLRRAQSRIVMLGQQNGSQRLASFLLDLVSVPEFFDAAHSLLKLPINRFDLADFLGTAPESAARAFAKLEGRGLIRRTTSRMIEILDLEGLRLMQRAPRRENREILPMSERTH